MIARLEGTLVDRDPTRAPAHIVVDCGGVGYDVACSAHTLAQLPPTGERVALRVFTHAQDNKISLFGFADAAERALFDQLITVKNVGPSTAIAILGAAAPRELAELIARGDVVGLTRIKGVGKKTAELLVVELRDKCEQLVISLTADGALRPAMAAVAPGLLGRLKVAPRRHPLLDEVAGALIGMGWRPNEADAAVAELAVDPTAPPPLEGLLRQALRSMPR